MNKVGLITYHAAYNFGSMLQAYATQEVIKELGYECDVINYRMKEQKAFYSMLRTKYGVPTFLKDCILIPFLPKRKQAKSRFEGFLKHYLRVTEEYTSPEEVKQCWDNYNTIVSGSDQIWNKHSYEMENNEWGFMDPFLLEQYSGKKISYASSVGGMTDSELARIMPSLQSFYMLSVREQLTKKRLERVLHREVENVLDPTLLFDSTKWIEKLGLKKTDEDPYILYYSLRGYKLAVPRMRILKEYAKKCRCKVKVITPFFYIPYFDSHFEYEFSYGPIEFLESVYNAKTVIAESYHGTILAANFNKDVYSLCGEKGSEYRKTEFLKRFGMKDRIIKDVTELMNEHEDIKYDFFNKKISELRKESIEYLRNSLA